MKHASPCWARGSIANTQGDGQQRVCLHRTGVVEILREENRVERRNDTLKHAGVVLVLAAGKDQDSWVRAESIGKDRKQRVDRSQIVGNVEDDGGRCSN